MKASEGRRAFEEGDELVGCSRAVEIDRADVLRISAEDTQFEGAVVGPPTRFERLCEDQCQLLRIAHPSTAPDVLGKAEQLQGVRGSPNSLLTRNRAFAPLLYQSDLTKLETSFRLLFSRLLRALHETSCHLTSLRMCALISVGSSRRVSRRGSAGVTGKGESWRGLGGLRGGASRRGFEGGSEVIC